MTTPPSVSRRRFNQRLQALGDPQGVVIDSMIYCNRANSKAELGHFNEAVDDYLSGYRLLYLVRITSTIIWQTLTLTYANLRKPSCFMTK